MLNAWQIYSIYSTFQWHWISVSIFSQTQATKDSRNQKIMTEKCKCLSFTYISYIKAGWKIHNPQVCPCRSRAWAGPPKWLFKFELVFLDIKFKYLEFYKDEQEAVPNELVATGYESEDESEDDEDYWEPKMDEMFKYFYEMITNIDKLPGNNFKKGAELEIKKVIEMADKMKRDRDEKVVNEFYWFDNGPKS